MRHFRFVTGVLLTTILLAVVAGCLPADDDDSEEATGNSDGLVVGTDAPGFRLKNQDQATIAFRDYQGERNVILVFYPLAFTPV